MIIRSQDKKIIVNLNNIDTIEAFDKDVRYFNGGEETAGLLATYSTEEKAIKVLDMIQKAYSKANYYFISNGFVQNVVFEMPQDSEV